MSENILNIDSEKNRARAILFLERQIKQIKEGGLSVFVRKSYRAFLKAFHIVCAIPLAVLMVILRPFVVIRLGKLDIWRIGCNYGGDWYLSERLAGMHGKPYFDIFYFNVGDYTVCNRQWLKMWQRALPVFPFWRLAGAVDTLQRKILGAKSQNIPLTQVVPRGGEAMDKYKHKLACILANTKPNIAFTREEEAFGQRALRELGIPEGKPFICFHARDAAFLNTNYSKGSWGYHDFRDSCISNYVASAEEMTKRGYYAIRMGAVVEKELDSNNPAIIDYAANGKRTEFLDIYLGAKCRFFICSQTGISIVPEVFHRPMVYVNLPALNLISTFVHNALVIPKKLYLTKERRFLTFKEIIQSGIGEFCLGSEFERLGIELIENTPEEIEAVSVEMDERIDGKCQGSKEDEVLQQRFWSFFGPKLQKGPGLRMGADFLRQNVDMFE